MRATETAVATLVAVTIGALAAGACRSQPPSHLYVIAQPDAAMATAATSGLRLAVRPFRVEPPYDDARLVYRVGSDSPEIGFYAYHRWAAPLGDQLAQAAIASFADLPDVGSIFRAAVGREHDAVLVGRLLYLEELDLPGEQIAHIGVELALLDEGGREVWAETVSGRVSGRADEVSEIVMGMRRATFEALGRARPGLTAGLAALTD